MSIAKTAPSKFEFQDLVCVELALRFRQVADLAMKIEPPGGEDAEMSLTLSGVPALIEVQIKGASTAVTIRDIVEMLAHFPPRQATGCLVERLLGDDSRYALIVVAGRCDDSASRYVVYPAWSGEPHTSGKIRVEDARLLLEELGKIDPPGTDSGELNDERRARCAVLASNVDAGEMRDAGRRLVVLERFTRGELDKSCEHILRAQHHVPSDRTAGTLRSLRDEVARAKQQALDAIPLIRTALARYSGQLLLPFGYVDRGSEDEWISELSRYNVLLLSGPPRCGKSDAAAEWLATINNSDLTFVKGMIRGRPNASCWIQPRATGFLYWMINLVEFIPLLMHLVPSHGSKIGFQDCTPPGS
jgi:hypothetical protein